MAERSNPLWPCRPGRSDGPAAAAGLAGLTLAVLGAVVGIQAFSTTPPPAPIGEISSLRAVAFVDH